jgi:hypothetical protein
MTAVACAVRSCVDIPLGIQILAGANHAALAVALASNAQFIRAEGFVFAHTADEGIMAKAAAGDLLRYRRTIGAQKIAVWADIKKKHAAHALTADVDLAETAQAADFFGADALIVTGAATGKAANIDDLRVATAASQKPIVVGSGVHSDSVEALWPVCDAFIVGSSLKQGGIWSNPVDETRVELFMYRVRNQRTLALRGTLQSSR